MKFGKQLEASTQNWQNLELLIKKKRVRALLHALLRALRRALLRALIRALRRDAVETRTERVYIAM